METEEYSGKFKLIDRKSFLLVMGYSGEEEWPGPDEEFLRSVPKKYIDAGWEVVIIKVATVTKNSDHKTDKNQNEFLINPDLELGMNMAPACQEMKPLWVRMRDLPHWIRKSVRAHFDYHTFLSSSGIGISSPSFTTVSQTHYPIIAPNSASSPPSNHVETSDNANIGIGIWDGDDNHSYNPGVPQVCFRGTNSAFASPSGGYEVATNNAFASPSGSYKAATNSAFASPSGTYEVAINSAFASSSGRYEVASPSCNYKVAANPAFASPSGSYEVAINSAFASPSGSYEVAINSAFASPSGSYEFARHGKTDLAAKSDVRPDETKYPTEVNNIILGITGQAAVALVSSSSSDSPFLHCFVAATGIGFLGSFFANYVMKNPKIARILSKIGAIGAASAVIVALGLYLPKDTKWNLNMVATAVACLASGVAVASA